MRSSNCCPLPELFSLSLSVRVKSLSRHPEWSSRAVLIFPRCLRARDGTEGPLFDLRVRSRTTSKRDPLDCVSRRFAQNKSAGHSARNDGAQQRRALFTAADRLTSRQACLPGIRRGATWRVVHRREVLPLRVPALRAKTKPRDTPLSMTTLRGRATRDTMAR